MILEMAHDDYLTLLDLAEMAPDRKGKRLAVILTRTYDGWTPTEIHRFLGCPRATDYRAVDLYHAEGIAGLKDKRMSPSPRKAGPEFMARVVTLLKTRPEEHGWMRSTWSCELLSLQIRKETGTSVHRAHLCRLLHREGAAWNRPRPSVYPTDAQEAVERLQELVEVVENIGPDEVLACQDEVDIHLNPKIGAMWMMKGEPAEVLTPGQNRKHYLAGSVDMRAGELVWVEAQKKNSDLFIDWLHAIAERHPTKTVHVILDNFIIHRSKKTLKALDAFDGRIKLHFLPPYCPQCNFMEHVWKQLHSDITRNHTCRTMEDLMTRVRSYMQAASPFHGSKPSISRLVS